MDETRGTGWITYAGIMLVIGGISAAFTAGRAWRYDDTPIDTLFYDDNLTVWGWIFLVLGVLTIIAGIAVMRRHAQWARWFGIVVSALVIFSRLSFQFVYPWESLLQVLLAALVIYGLVAHGEPLLPVPGAGTGGSTATYDAPAVAAAGVTTSTDESVDDASATAGSTADDVTTSTDETVEDASATADTAASDTGWSTNTGEPDEDKR
jgi:hypothetical protein